MTAEPSGSIAKLGSARKAPRIAWSGRILTGFHKALAAFALWLAVTWGVVGQVSAAGLIRDAETEDLIRSYAAPIFRAAGLGRHDVKIHLVADPSFNAFVVDGQNILLFTGAIMQSKTPNQLIGVIAHEVGHITGGHLARLRTHLARAQTASLMLQILGMAVMAAGAATGDSSNDLAEAGAAVVYGTQTVTMRQILAYRRTEESAADQAAIRYLNATRQSGRGMLETFEHFAEQGLASLRYTDPYIQSHPMPRQRIRQLRALVRQSPYYTKKDPPSLQLRHDLVRAKLTGFLEAPRTVFNRYPTSDSSLPAQYARAIATYRQGGLQRAMPRLAALVKARPKNPYFWELKGQFLLESGLARDAIAPLQQAVKLAPKSGLIRILLAQALLETGKPKDLDLAIRHLRKALVSENQNPRGYRQLATAYGRKALAARGKQAQDRYVALAELASAQAYFYRGRFSDAKLQAKRAKKKLRAGTPAWLKADDILNYKPPK